MAEKALYVLHGEIRTPPLTPAARIEAGTLLRRLQRGEALSLPHSRPMPSIGPRCHELRIPDQNRTWRVFYRTDADAILVAEVTDKTTRKTPHDLIDRCRRRLKAYDTAASLSTTRTRMNPQKRRRLEAAAYRPTTVKEFVGLSDAEDALVESRLALSGALRTARQEAGLSQGELAKRIGSSQSRIAKAEAADTTISSDLMLRAIFGTGVRPDEVLHRNVISRHNSLESERRRTVAAQRAHRKGREAAGISP